MERCSMSFTCRDSCKTFAWTRRGAIRVMLAALLLASCSREQDRGPDKMQLNGALFSFVSRGDDTAVRDILKKGADVNARDDNGCTPIVRAASGGYLSTAKLLLESGADLNTPCNHGPNALSLAAGNGQEAVVRWLIEKGADVNRKGQQGSYAIGAAIEVGHAGVVRALVDNGAEVNIRYAYHTPLIHAAERGRTEIVRILLDKGADVRATDHNGRSALLHAIEKGHRDLAKLLIQRGSDVNIRSLGNDRPLSLARRMQQADVVQALVAAGARERMGPPDDPAAKEQAKMDKVKRDLEQGGWQFLTSDLNILYYLKPAGTLPADDGIRRVEMMEYFTNSDELYEVVLEMDCSARTYRHISNRQRDISGRVIRNIPVDSYVMNDGGRVTEGSAMHLLFMRVCGKP